MKFSADRAQLAEALRWVAVAVPTKPMTAEHAGIRVTASEGRVSLLAHDGHTMHEAHVAAEVEEGGTSVPVGFMLRDLVGVMKGATIACASGVRTLDLSTKNAKGKVTSSYAVAAFTESPYPDPPQGDAEDVGTVDADELRRVLKTVTHAADDDNPVARLKGVRLEADGAEFRAVALRTACISVSRTVWGAGGSAFSVQMPMRGLEDAVKGLSGAVTVAAGSAVLRLATEARTVTLRIFDGKPADWSVVVPTLGVEVVSVESETLRDAVKRAAVTCTVEDPLRFGIVAGELTVKAGSPDSATGVELVEVEGSGEAVVVFFPELLTNVLSALPAGPVTMHFGPGPEGLATGKTAPMQLVMGTDHHIVMPQRNLG